MSDISTLIDSYYPKNSGGGGFLSSLEHVAEAPLHFEANLGSDLLHSFTGIPSGLVQLAEHPGYTASSMAKGVWDDWAPLVEGHPITWAKHVYDHPLAPLLDAASVFTGGAGLASKAADAMVAAKMVDRSSLLGRAVSDGGMLSRTAGKLEYSRPAHFDETIPGLKVESKMSSANPAVRLRQSLIHGAVQKLDQHLPHWFTGHILGNEAGYRRIVLGNMLHRHVAMNAQNADSIAAVQMQVAAMLKAGKVLSTEEGRKLVAPGVFAHNYFNLRRHAIPIKPGDKPAPGYVYVREFTHANKHKLFAYNPNVSIESHLTHMGKRFTTRNLGDAARVGNGTAQRLLTVPLHNAKALGLEGARSANFLLKMWSKPSNLWKMGTVGFSPKMVVNNTLGNWAMYAMRQGGAHSLRGVVDAIRYTKGEKAAMQAVKDGSMSAEGYMNRGWMQRHFRDEVNSGNSFFGSTAAKAGELGKKPHGIRQGLYPLVHKIADQPVRAAAIHAFLRGSKEVKGLMESKGWSFHKSVDYALRHDKTGLRDRAAAHARTIAGDYTRMTPMEQIVRQIIPFYTWDKHITKHTLDLIGEKPARVRALTGIGSIGSNAVSGAVGNLPSWMLSDVPLGTDTSTGRQKFLDARGLNPYSAFGDISAAALGDNTVGFQDIGSQVNPILMAGAQFLGSKLAPPGEHGQGVPGLVGSSLGQAFGNMPLVSMLQDLHGPQTSYTTKSGQVNPYLTEHDFQDAIMSMFGVPVKRVDMNKAHAYADQQQGKKKKTPLEQLIAAYYGG